MPRRPAFTLVELLVVIAIIGLLSTVAVVATSSARVNARNTQRKASMVQISKALELYYADNNSYPSTGGASWGNCSFYGSKADSGALAWITNLTPTYMASLPHDQDTNRGDISQNSYCSTIPTRACYLYKSDGIDYKLSAHCLPEGSPSSIAADPFSDPGAGGVRAGYDYALYTPGAASW